MRLRHREPDAMHGRHRLGIPPYIEIQKQLGKGLCVPKTSSGLI